MHGHMSAYQIILIAILYLVAQSTLNTGAAQLLMCCASCHLSPSEVTTSWSPRLNTMLHAHPSPSLASPANHEAASAASLHPAPPGTRASGLAMTVVHPPGRWVRVLGEVKMDAPGSSSHTYAREWSRISSNLLPSSEKLRNGGTVSVNINLCLIAELEAWTIYSVVIHYW